MAIIMLRFKYMKSHWGSDS